MLKYCYPQFLNTSEYYSRKYSKIIHLRVCKYFVQVLHIYRMLTVKSWENIHLLGYLSKFSPLKRKTSSSPYGVKLTLQGETQGLLVSLILGCFVKILHQIWNNKRFWSKLIELGVGFMFIGANDLQRCQSTTQKMCVYPKHDNRCNAIPILGSSFSHFYKDCHVHDMWGPHSYWKQL